MNANGRVNKKPVNKTFHMDTPTEKVVFVTDNQSIRSTTLITTTTISTKLLETRTLNGLKPC